MHVFQTREHPTGAMRCRRQAVTGRLVLQIEIEVMVSDASPAADLPPPGYRGSASEWRESESRREAKGWRLQRTYLRDATVADLIGDRAVQFMGT